MKTAELIGPALDWAVAKCEGGTNFHFDTVATYWITIDGKERALSKGWAQSFTPSTDWSQGGPIIEREGIDTWCTLVGRPDNKDPAWQKSHWRAKYSRMGFGTEPIDAETPLIAAMRCLVASKLGNEVEIPEELVK